MLKKTWSRIIIEIPWKTNPWKLNMEPKNLQVLEDNIIFFNLKNTRFWRIFFRETPNSGFQKFSISRGTRIVRIPNLTCFPVVVSTQPIWPKICGPSNWIIISPIWKGENIQICELPPPSFFFAIMTYIFFCVLYIYDICIVYTTLGLEKWFAKSWLTFSFCGDDTSLMIVILESSRDKSLDYTCPWVW